MKKTAYETDLIMDESGVHVKIEAGSLMAYRDALINELHKINTRLKEPYCKGSSLSVEAMEFAFTVHEDDVNKEIERVKGN